MGRSSLWEAVYKAGVDSVGNNCASQVIALHTTRRPEGHIFMATTDVQYNSDNIKLVSALQFYVLFVEAQTYRKLSEHAFD